MRLGLSVYGTMFSMGIIPAAWSTTADFSSSRARIRPVELIDQAISFGLEGVEIPVELMKGEDEFTIAQYACERNMFISLETSGFDAVQLSEELELAAKMKVPTLRTIVMGANLGGDRRPMAGRWQAFLEEIHKGLRKATETAEKNGVILTVENHQDIASEELLDLCESIDSKQFGITFDTGSTLATAEEPVVFARRAAKYIRHVHLKDYHIYLNEEGYRLVRCPLGQGVINFPEIFKILSDSSPDVTMTIEVGALEARQVRVLAADYWPDYPPRSAAQFAELMRFVMANAKPNGDWRTPFERGETVENIMAYEHDQLNASIAYLQHTLKNFHHR